MNQRRAGVFLNYVSVTVHLVIGVLYTPYMLRMLGKSEFGLYSLAASIVAYLTILDLGFGNAIIRYTAKFRAQNKLREQEQMFGMFLVLYSIIGLVTFGCGLLLTVNVENLFGETMTQVELSRARIMLWLMTINLAITFPMSIWGSIMSAYERFVFQRVVVITRTIANPLVMVALLAVGYKAVAMVVVTTLFNIATLVINWWYCKFRLNVQVKFGRFNWSFLKEVSIYSFWIFLNVIMDKVYWSTGQFVLGIYRGTVSIAIYSVAITLQHMYNTFSGSMSSILLPKITALVATGNDHKAISDLFIRTGRLQFCVMSYILCSFIIFGQPFIRIWAGSGYENAYIICLMFFIPLTVPLIQNVGISILQARNQMKFRSITYVIIALLSLGISIPMSKYYGEIGCAMGTSSALILGQIIIMNIYYYKKQYLDIPRFWMEIFKMSITPAIVTSVFYYSIGLFGCDLTKLQWFVLSAIVYSIIYILLFSKFSMNVQERAILSKPFLRILKGSTSR